ncbi:NADAR family protein [Cellulosimicrobium cellulans]|uniref:NADAR family protein n=2 Tax=Cellulosimicrobium cellulans TaxID=1710 RepID=UPI0035D84AEB
MREDPQVHTPMSLRARTVDDLRAACSAGEAPRYVHFWSQRPRRAGQVDQSCLSQWWPVRFEVDGESFGSAEQYMMWRKARLFGDDVSARAILEARSAAHAKALGRGVRDFDDDVWLKHRWEVVVAGSVAKFRAADAIGAYLRSTRERVLAEASPVDKIWGIGLAANSPDAALPHRWPGTNLLGFALMEARGVV